MRGARACILAGKERSFAEIPQEHTMSARDRRSHDQKRKAKRAKRAKRQPPAEPTPYEGTKYQAERWVPHVYQTESAIYETILLSNRSLTNAQVREALTRLIAHLREGHPALLPEEEPEMLFVSGVEIEFLVWNIRRHWRQLFQEEGPVSHPDLIGILRTLLHSIEAHAWHTGPSLGYVAFLEDFMGSRR
jgi:hypothetical protein